MARAPGAAASAMMATERGQVITFYSYKGGTGRSMALANIACLLASEQAATGGRPVLAIDWDLEAPGLHRYFEEFLTDGRAEGHDGLIELVQDLRERVRTGCAPDEEEAMSDEVVAATDLQRFVIPTAYPKLAFMQAGRFDDTYSTRTNTFPWQDLFTCAPSLFRTLAERLADEFSYVLIDSRTGITDTSGICTTLMPEKLVLVFTPNRQSLTGLTELVRRAYSYRRASDDVRPLVVYPLPSRIETSLPDEMKRWRLGDGRTVLRGWEQEFTDLLRDVYELPDSFSLERYFDAVQAQHVPPYAYGEQIAVLRERGSERLTLTKSYDTFRGYLVRDAPWHEETSHADEAARQATLERLNRLNEEFRAATEAVRPQSAAPPPAVRKWHPLNLAYAAFIALLVLVPAIAFMRTCTAKPRSSALSRVLADADDNRASTTVLLLAAMYDDLPEYERNVAAEQLRDRLAYVAVPTFRIAAAKPRSISIAGDHLLFMNDDGKVSRLDMSTGAPLPAPGGSFLAAAERDDGSVVTIDGRGTLTLYENDRPIDKQPLIAGGTYAFGPRGRMCVRRTAEYATVWAIERQAASAAELRTYAPAWATVMPNRLRLARKIQGIAYPGVGAFSGDGTTLVCARDGALTSGAVALDRSGAATIVPIHQPRLLRMDASGSRIAAVMPDGVEIFDAATGRSLAKLSALPPDLAFDPTGKSLMAIIPVNSVAQFDAESGTQTGVLSYNQNLRSVDFLDDGRALTVFSDRITIGQPLATRDLITIEPDGPIVETAHIGSYVVVATDASVAGWRLDAERPTAAMTDAALLAEVCRRAGRDLTDQEWTTYFGSAKKEPVCPKSKEETSTK